MKSKKDKKLTKSKPPPIYIASCASGASGDLLVNSVLAQFPDTQIRIIKVPNIRRIEQMEDLISRVKRDGGTIVHTLVDEKLRNILNSQGQKEGIVTIDLMGDLMSRLIDVLGQKPLGQPGLYRQIHHVYFDRIEAIEFTMAHDDGQRPHDLSKAEIVLIGISRVGKSPISMYLSVLGWKVANLPLIKGIDPPQELFKINHQRVIGLNVDPDQLLIYRKKRLNRMGKLGSIEYTKIKIINEEVETALRLFRRNEFTIIDVTNKPIETSADEIVELITRRFKSEYRKSE